MWAFECFYKVGLVAGRASGM